MIDNIMTGMVPASAASEMFDDFNATNNDVVSLESLIGSPDMAVGCHKDTMQLKQAITNQRDKMQSAVMSTEGLVYVEYVREMPTFITNDSPTESTLIINFDLIIGIYCGDDDDIHSFIKQLSEVPKGSILNIIIELGSRDIYYYLIETGPFIINMLKQTDCVKIFNFGSEVTLSDLMIAMCCNEVYVSDFASVSITRADNGESITRYLVPVYEFLIKETYAYWIRQGLFTTAEVDGLFESESDNSIQLLSDEIKARLKTNDK